MNSRRARQMRKRQGRAKNIRQSNQNGIYAVRRHISPANSEFFEGVAEKLEPKIINAGRLLRVGQLSVTVIGFSRFSKKHRFYGVPTERIAQEIPSATESFEAKLGSLSIFG